MTLRVATLRALRLAGGTLLIMVGIWAGVRVYTSRTTPPAAPAPLPPTVKVPAGEASPPTPSDVAAPDTAAIPDTLPDFSLADRAGKPTPIAKWHGKSLIINFWATWCAPCRHEIPLLQAMREEWRARDVEVIGIAVDHADKVNAYADKLGIAYPLLIGEEDALEAAAALGVQAPAFPFTVFADRRGDVVALFMGELRRPQVELILSTMRQVDAGSLSLTDARHHIADALRTLAEKQPS